MKRNNKQQGFTIIELVVVILLLGILTATALPRFMNVSDQAHEAVVNGVVGGLRTSSALAHASWVARGQPATLNDYEGGYVTDKGYFVGTNSTRQISTSQDCVDVFDTFLQEGRPNVHAIGSTGALATTDLTGAATTADFVAKANSPVCSYAYVGQYRDGRALTPVVKYSATDGSIEVGTFGN